MENKDNKQNFLSESWLNGTYKNVAGIWNVEINTSLSFAAFENNMDENETYTFQGDEGNKVIEEINYIYNTEEITADKAIEKWCNIYL